MSFAASWATVVPAGEPQLGSDPLEEVIAAMTLEEKVNTVIGVGFDFPGMDLGEALRAPNEDRPPAKVPGAAGYTYPIPRLGIPSIVLADGPAGVRILAHRRGASDDTYYCTAFPIARLLASSWDVRLAERVGKAMGREAKEYGIDVLLAPAMNIQRFALGGRNFEYLSEDPLVSGKIAAAIVRGVQANDIGTSLKHFVANNHEWNRYVINVKVDDRALREIYLRGFEIAVKESQPWTIMSSYNKVNGTYTSERGDLLTDVLRDEWGFRGFVMSDWFAGRDAIAQMRAGNDMLMPGTLVQQKTIREAVESGELDEAVLDRNIQNILNVVLRTPAFHGYEYSNNPNLKAHAAIARTAAAEGMVLLKNDGKALPLPSGGELALFGNSSYDIVTGGTGSGDVNEAYSVSLVDGLADAGFRIDRRLMDAYMEYLKEVEGERPKTPPFMVPAPLPERIISTGEASRVAHAADIGVVTIGRNSGEGSDRKSEGDFYLSEVEQRLLQTVADAFHAVDKKVVVVLNVGGVIETASWRNNVDAILLAWQPGQEAGHSISDVMSGDVNPSGRLTTTFALRLDDYPPARNFPGKVLRPGKPDQRPSILYSDDAAEIEYQDGIWVGYRYFNTNNVETAYPFGYGLSYTVFKYDDAKLTRTPSTDEFTGSVTVTNVGDVAGKDIVQIYVAAPKATLEKPEAELRAFGKTHLLKPGEAQVISVTLAARDLASYDQQRGEWRADAGRYTMRFGSSSEIEATIDFSLDHSQSWPP